MAIGRIALRAGAALAVAALVTACSTFHVSSSREAGETDGLTEASMARSWERALELLNEGDEYMAEAELVLARESAEYRERARLMLGQIRTPPGRYFPAEYFHVELSRGQSLSSLAERYLGEPLEFYALARYNAIDTPGSVAIGQQIRIPLTDHAARVRQAETGAPDTDDPITDPDRRVGGSGDAAAAQGDSAKASSAEPGSAGATEDGALEGAARDGTAGAERRERVARQYRLATQAFQQQDLDATIRHCERVLELDSDHANCKLYRARARELKERLADIPASD